MQRRFGQHMPLGCAGENIIVEGMRRLTLDDIAQGLVVLGTNQRVKGFLTKVEIARPCKAFTGFALHDETAPAETLKAGLQFLDAGLRGFR
jgi:hypothetical protein